MHLVASIIFLMTMITNSSIETSKPRSYLALGDSYTIGESVAIHESFPYQTIQFLRKKGVRMYAPEIIAKTGWTTDELIAGINQMQLNDEYDYVSLLIGVNNQYRGRSIDEYEIQFEELLKKAIKFAKNKNTNVFVISIPDWGATPFAEGRDRKLITQQINAFNTTNKKISAAYNVHYIEITEESRMVVKNQLLVANDKLHPSAVEYKKWAEKLSAKIFDEYQR